MQERIARSVVTGQPIRITWEDGILQGVEAGTTPAFRSVPADVYISPGFMDLQLNGWAGVNFGDPNLTVEQVARVVKKQHEVGVTGFLPTLITDDVQRMEAALRVLARAARQPELRHAMPGIHLEGPYLSDEDGPRGAHPREFCKDPDWDEFQRLQEAADGLVRLVTLAPERDGAIPFIEKAVASGVRIAIGHTGGNRDQILAAVDAGATLATHLGNAAHDRIQRHHNYLWDQLGEDRLAASLIVDGHHLPPNVVQIFVRAKGISRTILISDAVQHGGLPPGTYQFGHQKVVLSEDGAVRLYGQPRLAGSALLLLDGVSNLMRFAGCSLADAVRTVTSNPAEFLGIEKQYGSLFPGSVASFLLFRWAGIGAPLEILETVSGGQSVHGAAPSAA